VATPIVTAEEQQESVDVLASIRASGHVMVVDRICVTMLSLLLEVTSSKIELLGRCTGCEPSFTRVISMDQPGLNSGSNTVQNGGLEKDRD
jgi:hypothetical protein